MCFTRILCDKKYYVRQFVITVITSISIVIKELTQKSFIKCKFYSYFVDHSRYKNDN